MTPALTAGDYVFIEVTIGVAAIGTNTFWGYALSNM
jgi:hypothetical protein